ncbi:MAG: sporulation protein YunB [Clostridiaceae bacterium]|nr:sporulation protein YunB [Clostridiaceae bacterium]
MRRLRSYRFVRRVRDRMPLIWLFIIFLVATISFLTIEIKLRPLVKAYAEGRAKYIATIAINEAVEEELENQGGVYDNLVFFEKNNNGDILALKTDSVKINRLKSSIVSRINDKINAASSTKIEVALGNIINGELFSGRGPKIPILLQMVNSANASFISEFTHAGINQTRHRILIETDVGMSVLLPGGRAYFEVTSQVNIAETIIVGSVPNSYTDIVDSRESLVEKYNDYGERN